MFLLMGIGYIVAVSVLVSEIVGGCAKRCRQFARRNSRSVLSVRRSSCTSQCDEGALSSQQRFRRIIFKRLRRDSEQPAPTIATYKNQENKNIHEGLESNDTNVGTSQIVVDQRLTEIKIEYEMNQNSNQNEKKHVETMNCGATEIRSSDSEAIAYLEVAADQSVEFISKALPNFKTLQEPEEEFGDIVKDSVTNR